MQSVVVRTTVALAVLTIFTVPASAVGLQKVWTRVFQNLSPRSLPRPTAQ